MRASVLGSEAQAPPSLPVAAQTERASAKATKALGITLLVYALLVATHQGEFWPFSIYPMFSRAKNTLHQIAVVDVRGVRAAPERLWQPTTRGELPGVPFAVKDYGVDPVDLAKYVRLTKVWDADRRQGLMDLFRDALSTRDVLIFEVWGDVSETGELALEYQPIVLLTKEGSSITPHAEFSGLAHADSPDGAPR